MLQDDGSYDTARNGFITGGQKDTVLVMPGEEIEILKPFEDYKGLFLYHCNNLEHEDMGMMRNLNVVWMKLIFHYRVTSYPASNSVQVNIGRF